MNNISNCPICDSRNFRPVKKCKDYTVSQESFIIVECDNCKFWFTNPRPLIEDLHKYYESEEYVSHSNTNKGLIHKLYQSVRNFTLNQKLQLINGLKTGSKQLLDIGSGTGEFSNVCNKNGWNVIGIEPSEKAREFAINNYNLNIKTEESLKDLKDNTFDVISMWHVLEHVYHLNERLLEIKRLLKEDGFLIVAVPNRLSYDASTYKEKWAAYDLPRHLYHFTPNDLENIAKKYSFELKEIKPMKFDSFYVSMLSEKYKNGKINYISAFFKGLISNLKAGTVQHYSSQIYLLKNRK